MNSQKPPPLIVLTGIPHSGNSHRLSWVFAKILRTYMSYNTSSRLLLSNIVLYCSKFVWSIFQFKFVCYPCISCYLCEVKCRINRSQVFSRIADSEKFRKFHRKANTMESYFNEVAGYYIA